MSFVSDLVKAVRMRDLDAANSVIDLERGGSYRAAISEGEAEAMALKSRRDPLPELPAEVASALWNDDCAHGLHRNRA